MNKIGASHFDPIDVLDEWWIGDWGQLMEWPDWAVRCDGGNWNNQLRADSCDAVRLVTGDWCGQLWAEVEKLEIGATKL